MGWAAFCTVDFETKISRPRPATVRLMNSQLRQSGGLGPVSEGRRDGTKFRSLTHAALCVTWRLLGYEQVVQTSRSHVLLLLPWHRADDHSRTRLDDHSGLVNHDSPSDAACDPSLPWERRIVDRLAMRHVQGQPAHQRGVAARAGGLAHFFRAASNSSPGCQPCSSGSIAAIWPSRNPKRAILASP